MLRVLLLALFLSTPLYGNIVAGPPVSFGINRGDTFGYDHVAKVDTDGSVVVTGPLGAARVRAAADGTADPATFAKINDAEATAAPPLSILFDGNRYVALAVVGTPIDSRLDIYATDAVSHVLLASKTIVPASPGRLIHSATLAFNGSSYGVAFSQDDYRSAQTSHVDFPQALEVSRSFEATPPVALSSTPQADERVDIIPAGDDFAVLWRASDSATIRSATIAQHQEQAFLRGDARQFPLTAAVSPDKTILGVWQEIDGPVVRLCAGRPADFKPLTLATAKTGVQYVAKAAADGYGGFLVVWSAYPPFPAPPIPTTAAAYINPQGAARPYTFAADYRNMSVDAIRFVASYFRVSLHGGGYAGGLSIFPGGSIESAFSELIPGATMAFYDGGLLVTAGSLQLTLDSRGSPSVTTRTLPVNAPPADLRRWNDRLFVVQRASSAVTVSEWTFSGDFVRSRDLDVPPSASVKLVGVGSGLFLALTENGALNLVPLDFETLQPGAAVSFANGAGAEDDLLLEATPVPGDLGGSVRMTVRPLSMSRRSRAAK